MSTRKEDTPNWGGNTYGTKGANPTTKNKDEELLTKTRPLTMGEASPDAEHSVGGPKVKDSIKSEPRSSVD
jgi:hypothetical protein